MLDDIDDLTPSEALIGFVSYLTTLPGSLQVGASHPTPDILDHLFAFIIINGFEKPREGWGELIKYPLTSDEL